MKKERIYTPAEKEQVIKLKRSLDKALFFIVAAFILLGFTAYIQNNAVCTLGALLIVAAAVLHLYNVSKKSKEFLKSINS